MDGCGCDHCDNPACWTRCPDCGLYEQYCACNRDDLHDFEHEIYGPETEQEDGDE